MILISKQKLNSRVAMSDYYMPKIDIDKTETKRLVQCIGKENLDNKLLRDLNILEQNIESIDTLAYSYIHYGNKLQFSDLSRGEKVFLVSLASKYIETDIYLQYDILQLTKTSLRKYYSLFRDCNNIHIICETDEVISYLTKVMQGEIL